MHIIDKRLSAERRKKRSALVLCTAILNHSREVLKLLHGAALNIIILFPIFQVASILT
jgi:hypothetical protein